MVGAHRVGENLNHGLRAFYFAGVERLGVRALHAGAGEQVAVIVEEVGHAVERDGGFAGAGAALDDHDAARGVTNDLILLALDGLDDGGHVARAGALQRGVEGGLSCDVAGGGIGKLGAGEHLVVDAGDGATLRPNVAAENDALGLGRGREVKGAGHGRAPVEEQRAVVVLAVIQAHATDVAAVEALLGGVVARGVDIDAAEDEAELREVELVQLALEGVVLRLAAHEGVRVRILWIDVEHDLAQALVGGGDLVVKALEQSVDIRLLGGDGVGGGVEMLGRIWG